MAASYQDRIDCDFYGEKLIIHRRADCGDNFWFRAKIEGRANYIRRSCKTSDAAEALAYARKQYDELRIKRASGGALVKLTFEKYFLRWLSDNQHRLSEKRHHWKKWCFERYLNSYFGNKQVSEIDKVFADRYWKWRLSYWQSEIGQQEIAANKKRINAKTLSSHNVALNPAYASLKMEASLINEVLRAAYDEGEISRLIKVSAQDAVHKDSRGDGYRDSFTKHEWRVLTRNLHSYAFNLGKHRTERMHSLHSFQRHMLRTYVLFSSSTGMRVGEIKQMRWGDLKEEMNSKSERIIIVEVRGETSKRGRDRQALAHSEHTTHLIAEWKALCEANGYSTDNDRLVFFSTQARRKRGSVRQQVDKQEVQNQVVDLSTTFKTFLANCNYQNREGGLRFSSKGKARTLYSLRHFYATQRLESGKQDIGQLATLMGTGITQIRNHYGRHIRSEAFIDEATRFDRKTDKSETRQQIENLVAAAKSGDWHEEELLSRFKRIINSTD